MFSEVVAALDVDLIAGSLETMEFADSLESDQIGCEMYK